jgi:hypothetical protein
MKSDRVAVLLGFLLLVTPAVICADVTTERSASILVWPKVIANGTRDTIIQITNTSNSLVRAHCFYVNASLADPSQEEGPLNPRLWLEIDFDIVLTRQQPTFWLVSRGRPVNPTDPTCHEEIECLYAGFDPGLIPPVVPDFEGELKCVQVDDSGAPLSGNNLIGEGKLTYDSEQDPEPGTPFVQGLSSYNAIGILGNDNNGDGTLVLGGGQCGGSGAVCSSDDDCGGEGPCVFEYNACPETWILNHLAEGAPNIVLEASQFGDTPSAVTTELTIVPCTQNFETQVPTTVTVQFLTWNEFELQFSTSTSLTCWTNFELGDIGAPAFTFEGQPVHDPLGTLYLQTRMRPAAGTPFGLLMVAEEFHASKPSLLGTIFVDASPAAANLHIEGERAVPDIITIPAEQLTR